MMYFRNFPQTLYQISPPRYRKPAEYVAVTDIVRNVRFKKEILDNITLYDKYIMKDGETPEVISEQLYGSPFYHWVIMLLNDRFDYLNDFVLDSNTFNTYVDQKYNFDIVVFTFASNQFQVNNVVEGTTSGSHGIVVSSTSTTLIVKVTDGTFVTNEPLQVGTATQTPTATVFDTYTNYIIGSPPEQLIVDLVDPAQNNKSIDLVSTLANPTNIINKSTGSIVGTAPLISMTIFEPVLKTNIKKFANTSTGATLDLKTYRVSLDVTITPVNAVSYEAELNEQKREVKILSEQLLQVVLKNFKDLI